MVLSFVISAVSAVVSAVSSIGPAVAGFCTNVLPKILPFLEKSLETLNTVGNIANIVSTVFGIFNGKDTVEDIGNRAIQAAAKNITPDQFEDHAEYMNKLRDFDLNPDKSKTITPIEKLERTVAGLAIAGRCLDEEFGLPEGTMGNLWLLASIKSDYFDADKLTKWLKTGQDIMTIVDYFEGKLGGGEALEIEDKLVALDQAEFPAQEEKSIRAQIYAAADAVQQQAR